MTSLMYLALPLLLLLFSSVISYVLLLLVIVIFVLRFASLYYSIRTLLRLVIITVYIGAMITLFVYVRAVSPNDYVHSDKHSSTVLTLLPLLALFSFITPDFITPCSSQVVGVSTEIFTGRGLYLTIFVTLILLLMLLVSTYSTPSLSIFRSLQ